ncbi:MAG: DUF3822 family protein [Bacteroidetes bacterium]|nr:MAG: DUF3822 family protein [Bacteroidota bacterium]
MLFLLTSRLIKNLTFIHLETLNPYSPVYCFKDSSFNVDKIAAYHLCLNFSAKSFDVAIFETAKDFCLHYESYRLQNVFTIHDLIQNVEQILQNHEFLQAGFWHSVVAVVSNQKFSFVPQDFFDDDQKNLFLSVNAELDNLKEEVLANFHRSQKVYNIFSVEKIFIEWLNKTYANRKPVLVHEMTAFIEGLLTEPQILNDGYLHLLVKSDKLLIASFKNGELNFVNSFLLQRSTDFLYFVMLVLEELGLDKNKIQLHLYGEIEKQIQAMLAKFTWKLGQRIKGVTYSSQLDELAPHLALDTLSAYHVSKPNFRLFVY